MGAKGVVVKHFVDLVSTRSIYDDHIAIASFVLASMLARIEVMLFKEAIISFPLAEFTRLHLRVKCGQWVFGL